MLCCPLQAPSPQPFTHAVAPLHPPSAPAGCRGITAAARASQSQPTPSQPQDPPLLWRRPRALLLKRQQQRRRRRRERRRLGMGLHSQMQRQRAAPASSRATSTGLEPRYTMCRAVHRTTKRGLMSRRESAGSVVRRRRWLPAGALQARSKRAMQCLCLRHSSSSISRAPTFNALPHWLFCYAQ